MKNNQGYLVTEGSAVYSTVLESELTRLREIESVARELYDFVRGISYEQRFVSMNKSIANKILTRASKILSPGGSEPKGSKGEG